MAQDPTGALLVVGALGAGVLLWAWSQRAKPPPPPPPPPTGTPYVRAFNLGYRVA
jgi:hypothetical protein